MFVAPVSTSSLFKVEKCSTVWGNMLFTCSSVDGHWIVATGLLQIMLSEHPCTDFCVCVCDHVFSFILYF